MNLKTLGVITTLLLVSPLSASAATLYLDPNQGTYGPGDTFIENIRINTEGDCFNAANIVIMYPKESMRAVDFGKGGSILSLWVTEPKIDPDAGTVTFSGGIPGGYCGRIQGDPALTNSLGKVVFTVTDSSAEKATIRFAASSAIYLNDGQGTKVMPTFGNSTIRLASEATLSQNAWLKEVGEDKLPPEPFDVQVISTRNLFGGKYYAAFSTVDKQSGLDHYEMVENGTWQSVESPHVLNDQSLRGGIQVRAIDKAGNVRLGTYVEGSVIPREVTSQGYLALIVIILLLVCALFARKYLNHRQANATIDLRS